MAIPPWTIELLRRGITDVARKASQPDTLNKIKNQAAELLQELPETAARGLDAVMRSAEGGKKAGAAWSGGHADLSAPLINGSGTLVTELGTGLPLTESAAKLGGDLLTGNRVGNPDGQQAIGERLAAVAPTPRHRVAVANNFPAALAAFSVFAQRMPLVIHRHHCVRLPGGVPLADAFSTLVPVIEEVGASDEVLESDFDGLTEGCLILADNGNDPVSVVGKPNKLRLAVVLPVGTMHENPASLPNAAELLKAGVDYVIMPGDGIQGGPGCGLIVGPCDDIEWLESQQAWSSFRANDLITAVMTEVLNQRLDPGLVDPLQRLLESSEDNLRNRAERMATRLSASPAVDGCRVTALSAKVTEVGRWEYPSRQVCLRPSDSNAQAWSDRLKASSPCVLAKVQDAELSIDLRWVPPSMDSELASVLTAGHGAGESGNEESKPEGPTPPAC